MSSDEEDKKPRAGKSPGDWSQAVNPPTPNHGNVAEYKKIDFRVPLEVTKADQKQVKQAPGTKPTRKLRKDPNPRPPVVLTDAWNQPELRYTPKYYPYAKTNLTVANQDLQTLTKNIAECFKATSCQAKYCNSPVSAYLLTLENGEMHVALWKTKDNEIVVEIQRRRGDPISFHNYAQLILDAAEGKFNIKEFEGQHDLDIKHLKEAEESLQKQYPMSKEEQNQSIISTLETVDGLLKDGRVDARIMGMQSLAVLADPRKTGIATSVHISRVVLLGVGPNKDNAKQFHEIRDYLIKVIQNRDIGRGGVQTYDDDDKNGRPVEMQDAVGLMLNVALDILNYALEVLNANLQDVCPEIEKQESAPTTKPIFLEYAQELTGKSFIGTLVQNADDANEHSQLSCRSIISLRLFCEASKPVTKKALEMGVLDVAERARNHGSVHHSKLEKESILFIQRLQTV